MITNEEELAGFLGEGFHTALRKVAYSDEAQRAWDAISDMGDAEWASVLAFVADATWQAISKD